MHLYIIFFNITDVGGWGVFSTDKNRVCMVEILSRAAEVYYMVWTVVKFTLLAQPMDQPTQVSTNQVRLTQQKLCELNSLTICL